MVFFTCSHCGESIKKAKVEKHYDTRCRRNPIALTCIDCCKDFSAETYNSHTSCVSEQEKYSAKGFQPKESANKGRKKQDSWLDVIKSVQSCYGKSLNSSENKLLNYLLKFDNVPRKKAKFHNFLMPVRLDQGTKESIFEKIDAEYKKLHGSDDNKNLKRGNGEANSSTDVALGAGESPNKKRKKQQEEEEMDKSQEEVTSNPEEEKKLSKKKKKNKVLQENGKEENEASELQETTEKEEEKKLNKAKQNEKENKVVQENGGEENEASEHQETTEKGEVKKLSKKEKKLNKAKQNEKENKVVQENGEEENEASEHQETETETLQEQNEATTQNQEERKLSKKERKEKRKREKYEAELKKAETGVVIEEEEEQPNKKKKKKNAPQENGIAGNKKTTTDDTSKQQETGCPAEEAVPRAKFTWQDVIFQVLSSEDENKMPLKRLRKKVLAEYEASGSGSATDEKIIAKFNKKVNHIPGVVVLKDMAKLVPVH